MTQVIEHQARSVTSAGGQETLNASEGPRKGHVGRSRDGWYVARTEEAYTLSRHWPAKFDVSVHTRLPALHAGRLARQIRQDIWREMRNLRGFSPVVEIVSEGSEMRIRAGGRLMSGGAPSGAALRLDAVVNDPARRARWCRWARIDEGQGA